MLPLQPAINQTSLTTAVAERPTDQQIVGPKARRNGVGTEDTENPHQQIGLLKTRVATLNGNPEWGHWPDRVRWP